MEITVCDTPEELAHCAAEDGAARIREALEERDRAVIALAAGSSQIGMLKNLVAAQEIDWGKVIAFPLDEYVGLSSRHPASFSRYLLERFVERLPSELRAFYHVDGTEEDPVKEAVRVILLLTLIRKFRIWSWILTNVVESSRSTKAGLRNWTRCRKKPFLCPCSKSCLANILSVPFQRLAKQKRCNVPWKVKSMHRFRPLSCKSMKNAVSTSTKNRQPCSKDRSLLLP
jgi:hypothetical protein